MQPTPVEPVPANPAEPMPVPRRGRSGTWWWIVVGSVALAAILVAGLVISLRDTSPASADDLAALLVTPTDRTTTVKVNIEAQPRGGSSSQGVLWSVTQTWNGPGGHSGIVSLTQYQTEEQADEALARVSAATPGTRHDVRGHPGAFFTSGKAIGLLGFAIQPSGGAGTKGTVLASVFGTSEDPAFLQDLLTQQLDRLP
jgi:hypothetical protein